MPVDNNTNYPVKSPYNGINALDYVPILSIPSNVAILILKIIFSILSIKASSENSFIAFVINKSSARCFLATVLPFGFFIMIPLDIMGRKKEVIAKDEDLKDLDTFLGKYPENIENENKTDGYQSKTIEHLHLEFLTIKCQPDKDDKSIRVFFQSCLSFIDSNVDKIIYQKLVLVIVAIGLLENEKIKNRAIDSTLNNDESLLFSIQFINTTRAIDAFIKSPDDEGSKNALVKEKDLLNNELFKKMELWISDKMEKEHPEISIDEDNSHEIEENIIGDNSENSSNDIVVDKEPNTQQITMVQDVEKKIEQNRAHNQLYEFILSKKFKDLYKVILGKEFQNNLLVNQIPEKFEIEFLLDKDSDTNADKLIKAAMCYEFDIGVNQDLLKAMDLYFKATKIICKELEILKTHTITYEDENYRELKLQMIKERELLYSKIHYTLFLLEIIVRPESENIEKQFDLVWKLSTKAQREIYSNINSLINRHLEKNKNDELPIKASEDTIIKYGNNRKKKKPFKNLLIKDVDNNVSNN
jgi:hypothetical protein